MKKRILIFLAAALALTAALCGCAPRQAARTGTGRLTPAQAQPAGEEKEAAQRTRTATAPAQTQEETTAEPVLPTESETSKRTAAKTETEAAETTTIAPKAEPVIRHTAIRSGEILTDALRTDKDERWYDFSVPERGIVKYALSAASKQNLAAYTARLYQEYFVNGVSGATALRLLDTLQVFTADGEGESPNVGVIPGNYRLLVTAGDVASFSDYAVKMTFSPRTDYEVECNDTPTRYTEIYSGIQVRGSASYKEDGSDADWYQFRLYRTGAVNLRFRHATGTLISTAFRVTLYNRQFEEIYSGVSPFSLGTLDSGTLGLEAGVYYVCVESRVYYAGDYGLTVTGVSGDGYESEPNDTADRATLLAADTPVTGAPTSRGGADRDYFVLKTEKTGFVQFTLTADGGGEGDKKLLRLTVCDAGGAPIYAETLNDAQGELTTPALGLPAGTWYVCADNEGLSGFSGDYRISYTLTPEANAETEPNDTPAAADALRENIALTGVIADGEHGFDTDVYSFTLPAARQVTLRFGHSAEPRDAEIYTVSLTDATGKTLRQTGISAAQPQTEIPLYLPAGTYFIKVGAGLYSDGGRYTIGF